MKNVTGICTRRTHRHVGWNQKSQHVASEKKIDDRTAVRTGDGLVYVAVASVDFRMLFHNSVHRRCGFSGNANRDQTIMTRS